MLALTEMDLLDHDAHLQQAAVDFDPLPFDANAARAFGKAAASFRDSSRETTARSFDAQTGAIALANVLRLYTYHPDHFAGIDNLVVVYVPVPI